jgi:hypothetical protein
LPQEVSTKQDEVIMPFKWWKKKALNPVSKSRLPIRLTIAPDPATTENLMETSSCEDIGNCPQDRVQTHPGELVRSMDHIGSNPYGRCGFSTGADGKSASLVGLEMILQGLAGILEDELLRHVGTDADNLEECLTLIGEKAESPEEELLAGPLTCGERQAPDYSHSDYSLWGKRIPGSAASSDSRISIKHQSHCHE